MMKGCGFAVPADAGSEALNLSLLVRRQLVNSLLRA